MNFKMLLQFAITITITLDSVIRRAIIRGEKIQNFI